MDQNRSASGNRHRSDVLISLIDYHRLIDTVHWPTASYPSLVAVALFGTRSSAENAGSASTALTSNHPVDQLILIVAVARFWGLTGRDLTWPDIGKVSAMVFVPMAFVLKQPDLGTSLTYLPILICGLFLGGIRFKQVAIILLALIFVGGVAWKSGKHLKPYQQARIDAFMNPDSDPRGSGYQIRQSLIAVGAGGVWGKGTNKGTQTQGDFLPIPYTDFIFAAFCEEHGFVGAVGVLLLYFLILMRLIQNAQTASDLPGSFIIMGVVAVIVFQVAVNVGMVVGLMPVTGIPLPLLSYGGSSVLFTFLALGIVMNVRMSRFVN